jgi:hypothetical protein
MNVRSKACFKLYSANVIQAGYKVAGGGEERHMRHALFVILASLVLLVCLARPALAQSTSRFGNVSAYVMSPELSVGPGYYNRQRIAQEQEDLRQTITRLRQVEVNRGLYREQQAESADTAARRKAGRRAAAGTTELPPSVGAGAEAASAPPRRFASTRSNYPIGRDRRP